MLSDRVDMDAMTARERVHAALERRRTDRVPVFMWFHPATTSRLARTLEIPLACVGDAMGNDIHQTWVNNNYAMEGIVHDRDGEAHVDAWGITWTYQYWYNQITMHPLAGASRDEVLAYGFPYEAVAELLGPMDQVAGSSHGYFLGCDVSPCAYEMAWRLLGMEETLAAMASDAELIEPVLRGCADFAVHMATEACTRYPLDWLWTGDDVASQRGMIVSPSMWREMIKPQLARVIAVGKRRGLPVAFHCCGALGPIIPDLIEIGVDVLNPVQPNCPGMEPLDLKAEFGEQLTFMGGVDTQELLPHGSAREVRRETQRLIDGMTGDGGGFILAASHSIPPETPHENIYAMYEVAGISRQEIMDRAADIRASLGPGRRAT
jgi:uroporphyrinogen decarboxylase